MKGTIAQRVASEVRAELARQRRPQRAVAEALGISQAAASRRLRGELPFDVAELATLATVLGVDMAQFLALDVA